MLRPSTWLASAVVVLSVFSLAGTSSAGGAAGNALRPAAGAEAAADGRVRLVRVGGHRSRILVRVRHLAARSDFEVRAVGGGVLGDLRTDRRGRGRARFRDADLPGGDASMLAGLAVELVHRDSGSVVLDGRIATKAAARIAESASGGVREAAAVFEAEGGVRAVLSLRSDPEHDRESMALRVTGLKEEGDYDLHLATGGDGMGRIGELARHDGEKKCERHVDGEHVVEECRWSRTWDWSADTAEGGSLPLGASDLDALAGRAFEVRDGEGHVRVKGEVPSLDHEGDGKDDGDGKDGDGKDEGDGKGDGDGNGKDDGDGKGDGDGESSVREADATFEGEGDTRCMVSIRSDPANDSERLSLNLKGVSAQGTYVLFVANAEGKMDDVARFVRDGASWWIRMDTAGEGTLPFKAKAVADLAGRKFEVRNGDGNVVVSGELPGFAE